MFKFPDELLNEFRLDWEAALRPNVSDFIARCHPHLKDDLAGKIWDYLGYAPTPPYSDVQRARLEQKVDEMVTEAVNNPNIMRRIFTGE